MNIKIKEFFSSNAYGVVGASADRSKYGNKVLRCYMQHNHEVYPVNPKEKSIEGLKCVHTVSNLPKEVKSISIITPPSVTKQVVNEAIKKGIKNIWMQPGSEHDEAIDQCNKNNINIIANGPCILAVSGFKDS
ncbi:CoA-binding protein [Legionella impletisoli]|uniref:CoA-binding protein n=1 Tax=Legionella impletisoli TaxID=343510 RepID=A0A917N8C0_9GAMM|nr:CoA-binding protein [Legionella impletisoli]GGI77455.1 CoA-binding protein [Legionella impletisoli]